MAHAVRRYWSCPSAASQRLVDHLFQAHVTAHLQALDRGREIGVNFEIYPHAAEGWGADIQSSVTQSQISSPPATRIWPLTKSLSGAQNR
jgi:hypothetical protein